MLCCFSPRLVARSRWAPLRSDAEGNRALLGAASFLVLARNERAGAKNWATWLLTVRELRQGVDLAQQDPPEPLWKHIAGGEDNPIDNQSKVTRPFPMLAEQILPALVKQAQDDQRDEVEIIYLADEGNEVGNKIEWRQHVGQSPQQKGLLPNRDPTIPQEPMEQLRQSGKEQQEITHP